jgi:hypothetical protein
VESFLWENSPYLTNLGNLTYFNAISGIFGMLSQNYEFLTKICQNLNFLF